MAYLVKRTNGSWEIRESRQTGKGPRSFTLATFREDTPEIRSQALRRSRSGLMESELIAKLDQAGVPIPSTDIDLAARNLLSGLASGCLPSEALRLALIEALGKLDRDPTEDLADAGAEDPGRILEDVLDLAVNLPYTPSAGISQMPLRDLIKVKEEAK